MRNLFLCLVLIVGLGGSAAVALPNLDFQPSGAVLGEMGPQIDPGGGEMGPHIDPGGRNLGQEGTPA